MEACEKNRKILTANKETVFNIECIVDDNDLVY